MPMPDIPNNQITYFVFCVLFKATNARIGPFSNKKTQSRQLEADQALSLTTYGIQIQWDLVLWEKHLRWYH